MTMEKPKWSSRPQRSQTTRCGKVQGLGRRQRFIAAGVAAWGYGEAMGIFEETQKICTWCLSYMHTMGIYTHIMVFVNQLSYSVDYHLEAR